MNESPQPYTRTLDAFIDEDVVTGALNDALDEVFFRCQKMGSTGERGREWPPYRVIIDSCQELWCSQRKRTNNDLIRSIARLGRVANVSVLLRTDTPHYLANGTISLSTIGDSVVRDMAMDDSCPAINFEVVS